MSQSQLFQISKEEINKFIIIKPKASDFKSLLTILNKAA